MPMEKPGDFGTNTNGSKNKEYCHYCYQSGKFTEPGITMEQMIEKCAGIMRQMRVPAAQIEQTKAFIPMLKRWQK
jgi:Putative zinc ribbon domain